jgi:hypothetical protein
MGEAHLRANMRRSLFPAYLLGLAQSGVCRIRRSMRLKDHGLVLATSGVPSKSPHSASLLESGWTGGWTLHIASVTLGLNNLFVFLQLVCEESCILCETCVASNPVPSPALPCWQFLIRRRTSLLNESGGREQRWPRVLVSAFSVIAGVSRLSGPDTPSTILRASASHRFPSTVSRGN